MYGRAHWCGEPLIWSTLLQMFALQNIVQGLWPLSIGSQHWKYHLLMFAEVTLCVLLLFKTEFHRHRQRTSVKMQLRFSGIICRLFQVVWFTKRTLNMLGFNWYERLEKKKLTFFRQAMLSLISMRNRSFHVMDETRTAVKCTEKKTRVKRAKRLVSLLNMQICDVLIAAVVAVA